MSAVVAGNLVSLAAAKPLRAKRGSGSARTRRVVSAAANADDARVADVKRAVVATLASAAIALPAVRAALPRYPAPASGRRTRPTASSPISAPRDEESSIERDCRRARI